LEMSPEELELTVQQRRRRAYTDMCIFRPSDLGSFTCSDWAAQAQRRAVLHL